jgi:hypothetical protein
VHISNNQVIVGAYLDADNGYGSGSAYIFQNNNGTWQQVAKLTASDANSRDLFGYSVSISGDYAIVGHVDQGTYTGGAYVFHKNNGTWQQTAKLQASDISANDWFGASVTLSGNYAFAGSLGNDGGGNNHGATYVFNLSNLFVASAFIAPDISLYPNPVNTYLTIKSEENNITAVEITDLKGRKIMHEKTDTKNKQLDLSGLKKGIYILQITTNNGIYSTKLLKN